MSAPALIRVPEIRLGGNERRRAAARGILITRSGRDLEDVTRPVVAGRYGDARCDGAPAQRATPKHRWSKPVAIEREWPEPLPVGALTCGHRVAPGETIYAFDAVRKIVCRVSGLDQSVVTGRAKTAEVVKARCLLYWAGKHYTLLSLPLIGRRVGGRDHTTILSGVRRVQAVAQAHGISIGRDPRETIARLWLAIWSDARKRRGRA